MTTKLTLTLDDEVISSAKKFARENGKSLSGMVENYLRSVTKPEEGERKLSPKIARLMGVIELPEDFDYKKDIQDALVDKYK